MDQKVMLQTSQLKSKNDQMFLQVIALSSAGKIFLFPAQRLTALGASFHFYCGDRLPASRPAVGVKRSNSTSAGVKSPPAPPAPPPWSLASLLTASSLLWDVWSDTLGLPVN